MGRWRKRLCFSARLCAGCALAIAASAALGASAQGAAPDGQTPFAQTLLRVFGRTHPILVHFPIALVLVAAMIETARAIARRPGPARTSINMLGIGVLAAGLAVWSGWLNGDHENHSSVADTMELHRWVGIGGGVAAFLAFLLGLAGARSRRVLMVFRAVLLISAFAIGFAGHLGGSMVYGKGYLLAPFSMSSPSADRGAPVVRAPAADAGATQGSLLSGPEIRKPVQPRIEVGSVSFERDILPIFEARCIECHGESKSRASLRLDTLGHAMQAEPWVLSIDDPDQSDLLMRVRMNAKDEGAMPPKGERLGAEEVAVIESWIRSLSVDAIDGAETVPEEMQNGFEGSDGVGAEPGPSWTDEQAAAITELRARGARIEPISVSSAELDVDLSRMEPPCDSTVLRKLAPLLGRVERLNLSEGKVRDADIDWLMSATAIRWLNLDRTSVGDGCAASLAEMPALGVVILTSTQLSDTGVRELARSRSIERVYGADSRVTEAGALSVSESIEVVLGVSSWPTVVYLARHAEKKSESLDPSLTEDGKARAQALARELAGRRIGAIFVTQFARTRETAAPLAERLGVEQTVMTAGSDMEAHVGEIVEAIRALPPGSIAVVIGHSNTIPAIIRSLGVVTEIAIDDSRYGDLFCVELHGTEARLTETRRFGP